METLLESNIVGIDSEIRTEYENGTAFRFPILSLCLDGLDRLLEKHEKAKQMLQEKIAVETTGVVHSLPIARTGFLSAGAGGEIFEMLKRKWEADNTEELARLKSKLEAEYAEKKKELISENFHKLAKQEQKQETGK